MKQLNDKNRRFLHRIKDFITELKSINISSIDLNDKTQKLSAERIFEKIGETIKRLSSDIYENKIFKKYRNFRNEIAHKLDIENQKLKDYIQNISQLEKEINYLISGINHSNPVIENFENYSKISTIENRKQLVDAVIDKTTSEDIEKVSFPKSKDIANYSTSIDNIINQPDLIKLTKENTEISNQLASDIFHWAKTTANKISKSNPYGDEEDLLTEVDKEKSEYLQEKFSEIKNILKENYTKEDFDLSFYDKKLKEIQNEKIKIKGHLDEKTGKIIQKDRPIDTLKKDFIETWSAQLIDKKLKYELAEIDKEREKFCKVLYEKIEQFNKLKEILEPFTNELGHLWDLSGGVWKRTGFDILQKYAELLKKDNQLKELAEQLGRFRKTEKEFEEEEFEKTIFKKEWKIQHASKSEFVGVHESDDLSSMLPSETALLSETTTESIFFKKFAEKKLQTFEFQSHFLDTTESKEKDKRLKAKESNKGPFVICVDTSGSMHGTPEYVAKVLCFAILKIAIEEKRKCYLISFSTSIQTMDLADLPSSLDKLIEFLQMSFRGGTDATPAVKHAIKMLNSENYKKADLLMISDFIMQGFDNNTIKEIEAAKERKSIFHSLTISNNSNQNVINQFDYNWIYNTQNTNAMIELVENIKKFAEKQ